MWTILKYKKNNLKILQRNLAVKLGEGVKFYCPQYQIKKFQKKKLILKTYYFLEDYIFCFHNDFKKKNILNNLKYTKGLKYFLNGFYESQEDIVTFINNCKKLENSSGYVEFAEKNLELEKYYEFISGPLANKIFKLIGIQKKNIKILIGSIKTYINKTNYVFRSV